MRTTRTRLASIVVGLALCSLGATNGFAAEPVEHPAPPLDRMTLEKVDDLRYLARDYEKRRCFSVARDCSQQAFQLCYSSRGASHYQTRREKCQLALIDWLAGLSDQDFAAYFSAIELVQEAEREARAGKDESAVEKVTKACATFDQLKTPASVDYTRAYLLKSDALRISGHFSQALSAATIASDLSVQEQGEHSPEHGRALCSMEAAYSSLGRLDEAVEVLCRASRIQRTCRMEETDNYAETALISAYILCSLGDVDRATDALDCARGIVRNNEVSKDVELWVLQVECEISDTRKAADDAKSKAIEVRQFALDNYGKASKEYAISVLACAALNADENALEPEALRKVFQGLLEMPGTSEIDRQFARFSYSNRLIDMQQLDEAKGMIDKVLDDMRTGHANFLPKRLLSRYAEALKSAHRPDAEIAQIESEIAKIKDDVARMRTTIENDPDCWFAWERSEHP